MVRWFPEGIVLDITMELIFDPGRLADILGRKAAMLLALSLFGMSVNAKFSEYEVMRSSQDQEQYVAA